MTTYRDYKFVIQCQEDLVEVRVVPDSDQAARFANDLVRAMSYDRNGPQNVGGHHPSVFAFHSRDPQPYGQTVCLKSSAIIGFTVHPPLDDNHKLEDGDA